MATNLISIRATDDSIVKLECHEKLISTAAVAREYARAGYSDRYAVIAEYAAGKETSERGIYMSLILRPSIVPSQAALLSSLATVALINALEEHTTRRLGIGWVSNIFCDGKQIGGVTIEGKLDNFTSYEYIIINFAVKLSEEDFPPRLTDLVKKVFERDSNSISTIIAKNILNKFFPLYGNMKNNTKFMNVYKQKFILHGVKIKYLADGKKESCKILGVDNADCSLIIERPGGKIEHVVTPASVIIPRSVKLSKRDLKKTET